MCQHKMFFKFKAKGIANSRMAGRNLQNERKAQYLPLLLIGTFTSCLRLKLNNVSYFPKLQGWLVSLGCSTGRVATH